MDADPARGPRALFERLPEGWSEVVHEGRRYGVTRTVRLGGRVQDVYAEELGGTDVVSANLYRTTEGDHLRPCEMPEQKVVAFLTSWTDAGTPA